MNPLVFNYIFSKNIGNPLFNFELQQARFNRFKCEIRMVQRFNIRHRLFTFALYRS